MKINLLKYILFTTVLSLVFTFENRVENVSPIKNLKKKILNENVINNIIYLFKNILFLIIFISL